MEDSASTRPHLKMRYHTRVEKVREYLETVKDFDELISPQCLFLHFLGPEPSQHVRRNVEIVKKRMTTRFSKAKLAEIQEKKAKTSLAGSLLMRKRQRDAEPPKDDLMVTSPIATSVPQCPASPTSFLELIASTSGASKTKKKERASSSSFKDDAGTAVLKAQEMISADDLFPLGVRSSHELMSSHVCKVMQIIALVDEAKKDKDGLTVLKKSIDTEKAFLRLNDKQIDEALSKVEKAEMKVVEKFNASDE
ncbi:hypothetical protein SO802_002252 [Lithocarpus litseifolius]|uniref:Uncharacterized protein n=1 Tax=Lithocarpus litseifolius TaxID=425828 RepID=A0AAW2DX06_9ROSI